MQLRKCCNHPYLFPDQEPAGAPEYGSHIMEASGKLILVDRIIDKVVLKGEKLLLFSGFTKTLDIIEDYLKFKKIGLCRLDGTTDLDDREEQINDFNSPTSNK